MTSRGPYRSRTAGMTRQEAAAWFRSQRQEGSSAITAEVLYLNAGSMPTVDHERVHEKKLDGRDGEYYNNCRVLGGRVLK